MWLMHLAPNAGHLSRFRPSPERLPDSTTPFIHVYLRPYTFVRGDDMARKLISSGTVLERTAGYSRAVVENDWVFVSGTTGFDYATMTISDDLEEQVHQASATLRRRWSIPVPRWQTSCAPTTSCLAP